MNGFSGNIEKEALENDFFRKVLYTTKRSQLVLMSLNAGEDIGMETHSDTDQFIRVEAGSGYAVIDDSRYELSDGSAIVIPAGAKHNVVNSGEGEMKLYTIYSPAHHKDGVVHKTKEEALSDEEEFDGETTE
jgi:mannose-6-phosphate isomerase-like protein (cupin superfamily)